MERHALVRDEVDWPKLRQDALGRAKGASGPADTYEAIEQALRDLDGHSTFLTPEEAEQAEDGAPDDQVLPEARRLPEGLGRLTLPPIRSDTAAGPYLRAARAAVREVDRAGACGWVVDLRTNTGGDMWTPLASAGPSSATARWAPSSRRTAHGPRGGSRAARPASTRTGGAPSRWPARCRRWTC